MIRIEKVRDLPSMEVLYERPKETPDNSFAAVLARICKSKGININKLNIGEPLKDEIWEEMKHGI